MILNDMLAVLLLPSIISSPQNQNQSTGSHFDSLEQEFGELGDFPDIFKQPSEEGQGLSPRGADPLLDAVNEDVRRLGLEYPDDYFDHLEDKSEEVRDLIKRRRQALDAQTTTPTTLPSTSSTDLSDPTPTQFPILLPQPEVSTTASTTKKPSGIGSAITGIRNEASSFFGKITNPISNAGRSLFGRQTTTTTTTTTHPPPPAPEALEIEESVTPTKNCSKVSQIFWKGDCRNLLQSQFCPSPTTWLVEDPVTLRPGCVPNPCHETSDLAPFGQPVTCIRVGREAECHPGMMTYIHRSGVVECDCRPGFLFNLEDGTCYEAFKRGPCSTGQHWRLSKGKPGCSSNPCVHEEYFCNAPRCVKQRNCERKGNPCGSGGKGVYALNPVTFTPTCREGDAWPQPIIGNVPTLSCAPGSRRDILGNCRTPTTIDFS